MSWFLLAYYRFHLYWFFGLLTCNFYRNRFYCSFYFFLFLIRIVFIERAALAKPLWTTLLLISFCYGWSRWSNWLHSFLLDETVLSFGLIHFGDKLDDRLFSLRPTLFLFDAIQQNDLYLIDEGYFKILDVIHYEFESDYSILTLSRILFSLLLIFLIWSTSKWKIPFVFWWLALLKEYFWEIYHWDSLSILLRRNLYLHFSIFLNWSNWYS